MPFANQPICLEHPPTGHVQQHLQNHYMQCCWRLFQFFDANLTEKHSNILLEEILFIVSSIGKQSCVSEYPDCRKFKTGNLGQGHLSGKQKYARIVLIYIAMCRTSVFESFEHIYLLNYPKEKSVRVTKTVPNHLMIS